MQTNSASTIGNPHLHSLPHWMANNPPEGYWVSVARELIPLSARTVINLSINKLRGPVYGLDRVEELASQGQEAAALDSALFAKSLVGTLSDQLSILDLQNLVSAFSQELANELQARELRLDKPRH